MFKNNQGIVHLFLLVVIVIIGIGGLLYYSWQRGLIKTIQQIEYYPTPTSIKDKTADWKTYINEKYKFSIKHPTGWEIKEVVASLNEGDETQILLSKENSDRIGDSIIFIVTSAETWDKSVESGYNDFRGNNLFNGYPADISIRGEQDTRPQDSITIKSPASEHYITIIFDYKLTDKKELIDQILSTFKFIDDSDKSSEENLRKVAQDEIIKYPELITGGYDSYIVDSTNIKGEWALISYASTSLTPIPTGAHMADINAILGVGRLLKDGWAVYIHNTEKFDLIKNELPDWLEYLK